MRLCAGMPGAMLHALHRAHRHAVQTAASSVGLEDLGSPMILMILQDWEADQEPPTQRELADAFHVTPATVAVSLKSLERGGYVAKTADSRDPVSYTHLDVYKRQIWSSTPPLKLCWTSTGTPWWGRTAPCTRR